MTGDLGNVFVTGGTGLLGSELVCKLLSRPDVGHLVCLVRDRVPQSRFYQEGFSERVTVVTGDIREGSLLRRVLNEYDIDTVFHLAAQPIVGRALRLPDETLDVNIRGTWELLEAVRQNGRVKATIVASSDKAYGDMEGEYYDEDCPLRGRHPYDVSKSCADLISQSYARSFDLPVCITRCGNFFGPGDLNTDRIFPSTILSLLKNESPVIRSDGTFVRDYIYVGDGAEAYLLLASALLRGEVSPGEAYNFSYGLRLTVLEVVERIVKLMGVNKPPKILNQASQEIPVQCLDSAKARSHLNWQPNYGFDKGLEATIDWYRSFLSEQANQRRTVDDA